MLISLDLSAAFDIIDHTILLSRLQTSFGISGLAFAWFRSYIDGRSQFVHIGCSSSPATLCTTGVPQGSVLGPMFFPYSSQPLHILSSYGLLRQQYVDGTLLYVAISKDNYDTPVAKLELCLAILHALFCYNGLSQTNPRHSCLALPSAHVLFQLSPLSMSPVHLSRFPIRSGFSALPSTVHSHLTHTFQHFLNPVSIISVHFATFVPISHSTASRTAPVLLSAINYANSTLMEISVKNISRLQRLQSTLTHIVTCQRGLVSIFKTLQELQWLPIKWRIDYKVATLAYKLL